MCIWGDGGGGHWLIRMEWHPAGWSVCLPLLISPCTMKSRSSILAPAHPGGPGKRAVKWLWWWCGGRVCILLCTTVVLNTAQNSSDDFPSYPPDNHHRWCLLEGKHGVNSVSEWVTSSKSKEAGAWVSVTWWTHSECCCASVDSTTAALKHINNTTHNNLSSERHTVSLWII